MFLVYRASHLPEPATNLRDLAARSRARRPAGHPPRRGRDSMGPRLGRDAGRVRREGPLPAPVRLADHARHEEVRAIAFPGKHDLQVYDYDAVRTALADLEPVDYRRYETVFPGWDNTARVGERAVVMHNATPAGYEEWLSEAVARARTQPSEHRIVFINAWNEWAEGCHLEPDLRHGHAYLDATRRVLTQLSVREEAQPRPRRGAQTIRALHDVAH